MHKPLRALLFITAIVCSGAILLTSCQPSKPSVKIGINAELTGEMPAVGASCKQAAELFAEQVNKAGGIAVGAEKLPLQLSVVDNSCKADQAAAAAQRLISQNGVLVMVGPNASSCAIPAGEIAECGPGVTTVKPGDHVIFSFRPHCGRCRYCTQGRTVLCIGRASVPPGSLYDGTLRIKHKGQGINQMARIGTFAEEVVVPEEMVVPIRKDMPWPQAALVGCCVATGVGAVTRHAKIEAGSTVLVIGCGGVGLAAVNGASLAGAERIIAIDRLASKLELAKQMGATDTIQVGNDDPVAQVRELTKGGVHYSFEALGMKRTAEQAFEMLRPGGTATIIGMVPFGVKIELHGFDFLRERKIQGSSMGSNRFRVDMPRLLGLWRQGRLKLDHLISSHIGLGEINEGFARLKGGEVVRQMIRF